MGRVLTSTLFVLSVAVPAAAADAVLLDETVAVVAARVPTQQAISVITRWDLEARCRIEMIRRDGKEGLDREPDKELRQAVLKTIVEETLVTMELTRIGFTEIDEGKVQEELDRLIEPFGGEEELYAGLAPYSISPEHLKSWIERSVLVDKYMEAQFYMTGTKASPSGEEMKAVKAKVRSSLIEEIKKRYRIWIF
jgi:hypothetical protein